MDTGTEAVFEFLNVSKGLIVQSVFVIFLLYLPYRVKLSSEIPKEIVTTT